MAGIETAPAVAFAVATQSAKGARSIETLSKETGTMTTQSFVGMWVTANGHIRHELLPNGRYDEARGSKRSAYQGRYVITGNHIDYVDDTGFTADGDFVDGVLHHAGMILRREN
jgi:putative ligand-binding protein with streptavidin-like fold